MPTLSRWLLTLSALLQAPLAQGCGSTPLQPVMSAAAAHLSLKDGHGLTFAKLGRESGLSQTRVARIVQDEQGFLWFATQYGLNRYDGYKIRHFRPGSRPQESLSGTNVYSLFKDRRGALWVGFYNSLDRLDPRTERVTHYKIDPDAAGASQRIIDISEDAQGQLWLASGNGLYRFDPVSGALQHYRHEPEDCLSLSSDSVKSTMEDREGYLWVATGAGIDRFRPRDGRVILHIPIRESREIYVHEDRRNRYWISYASGNGLAEYDPRTNRVTRYAFAAATGHDESLTGVTALIEGTDGQLWFGTATEGILRFDPNTLSLTRYEHHPEDPSSLSENRIASLFEDREGNIWVGLGASEPVVFNSAARSFTPLPIPPDNAATLGEKLVNAVLEDRRGILWIATTGALNRLDRQTGRYQQFQIPGGKIRGDVVSIAQGTDDSLWLATSGEGVVNFQPKTGKIRDYRHRDGDPTSLSSNFVFRVLVDHAGAVWVTANNGLNRFNPEHRTFDHIPLGQGTLLAEFTIAEDAGHLLWIANAQGLLRVDTTDGQFTPLGSLARFGERVNAILPDHAGGIWLATQYGLRHWNPTTGRLQSYREEEGLPSNVVSCLLEDESGNLWMSTTRGISRFDPRRATFDNYSTADGLPGDDMTGWSACSRSATGEMFFGGFAGATAFFPSRIARDGASPAIVLTELDVGGHPIDPAPGTLLTHTIGYTDSIVLPHDQNTIAFEFAALSFRSPTTNRYRYRLAGLDSTWQVTGSDRRLARYTALAPGQYRFTVQGATARGPWSEPGKSLQVEIRPPWWGTWWFKSVALIAIGALLAGAYILRMRRFAWQMTVRMQERLDERTRIARDLHDTLLQGLLSASLQLSIANSELPPQMNGRTLLARVAELLKQMIDESRNTVRGLRIRHLGALEDAIAQIPRDLHLEQTATMPLHVLGGRRPLRQAVRDEVYWIARESIANALRHAKAATIDVRIEYSRKRLRLSVRDDGSGIPPELLRSGRRDHWGLSGMTERARRIRAQLTITSELGMGTQIDLSVPATVAFETFFLDES